MVGDAGSRYFFEHVLECLEVGRMPDLRAVGQPEHEITDAKALDHELSYVEQQ